MYTKQDSVFWCNLNSYITQNKKYKNLSINTKSRIDDWFKLAYYGLLQYQLYKGRQLQSIELATVEQIANYIRDNFDQLYKTFIIRKGKEKGSQKEKEQFLSLLEEAIIPYINDYAFEGLDQFRITNENIAFLTMQLCIRNQFDINIVDERNSKKVFYSQIYPFLITLLIIDPNNPEKSFDNVRNFFTPKLLIERYQNGRSLSEEEIKIISPQLDLLNNETDFNYFLQNFTEENWKNHDVVSRFKVVFQLTKLTAILLKDDIYSLTYLENENDLYDLIEYYLPIILRNKDELIAHKEDKSDYYFDRKININAKFLLPLPIKDTDPRLIEKYYEEMKITDLKFSLDRLYKMLDSSLYSSTYINFVQLMNEESNLLGKFFIENKKTALVNSLKIFSLNENVYKAQQPYSFSLNDVFLDVTALKKIQKQKAKEIIKEKGLPLRLKSLLKLISYILALDPSQVKEFDYSLEEIIKYYLIIYGPYKKTKMGYNQKDFELLTAKIIKIVRNFVLKYKVVKDDEKMMLKLGYYLHIYLIEKLLEFSKNKD